MEVHDEANVGLVDAHAKGNRGHDDTRAVGHEAILDGSSIGQPGVIGFGADSFCAHQGRQRLTFVPAVDINDAATFGLADKFEQRGQLFIFIVKTHGRQMQIGPEDVQRHHLGRAWISPTRLSASVAASDADSAERSGSSSSSLRASLLR